MTRVEVELAAALAGTTLTTVDEDLRPALDRIAVLLWEKESAKAGEWRRKPLRHHLERLKKHAENALRLLEYGPGFEAILEEELAHMGCRGLMAVTLQLAAQCGDGE
jgi:hypothetical protein